MKSEVFSIYDSKVALFSSPFFMRSAAEAVRAFTDTVNNPDTTIHRHPDDYTLFKLGEFDADAGTFENMPAPLSVVSARDLVKQIELPVFERGES